MGDIGAVVEVLEVLTVLAVLAGWNVVVNRLLPDRWYVPANLAVTAGLVALARSAGATAGDLGMEPGRALGGLAVGAGIAVAVGAALAVAARRPATRPLFRDQRVAGIGPGEVAYRALVRIPLGTVVLEEMAFRGVLLAVAGEHVSTWAAVAASSAAFGLWHILPTAETLRVNRLAERAPGRVGAIAGAVVATGLAGVAFCALRLATGSLVAPAVVHAAVNSLSTVAAYGVLRRDEAGVL